MSLISVAADTRSPAWVSRWLSSLSWATLAVTILSKDPSSARDLCVGTSESSLTGLVTVLNLFLVAPSFGLVALLGSLPSARACRHYKFMEKVQSQPMTKAALQHAFLNAVNEEQKAFLPC